MFTHQSITAVTQTTYAPTVITQRYIRERDLVTDQNLSGTRTGCRGHRRQTEIDLVPVPTTVPGRLPSPE